MRTQRTAMPTGALCGVGAVLLLVPAAAQTGPDWYPVTSTQRPSGRWGFDMVYDSIRGAVVLFAGGTTGNEDLWIFDGRQWTQQFPIVHPPGRGYHAMAYDPARDRVVVFGGVRWSSPFDLMNDTWEWDGSQWRQRLPAHRPPARVDHRMVHDAARQRVVLYGGYGSAGRLTDLWEWDGTDWLQRTPAHTPPMLAGFALAYDAGRQRTVAIGGWDNGFSNDTWEWDGTDWSEQLPAHRPSPRQSAAMAYDASRGLVVLSGGTDGGSIPLGDTWTWNGADWQQVATPHAFVRAGHTMVHEAARGRMLAFGGAITFIDGLDETWALASLAAPPVFTPFGAGCAGSAGVPLLEAPASLPFLGAPFELDLQQLQANTFGFLMLGFSDTSYWHLQLPAELSSFLMPGCWLYTDIGEALWMTAAADGRSRCVLAIPQLPNLEGVRFFAQALVHDPTANARGFVTTNAGAAVLGSWR